MSSNSGYRGDNRRDFNPRGSYQRGGRGGGRGGYKPRRYWDSDDFIDRDKEHEGGGRRRYSRSRSRSRSYSRSRSRSPAGRLQQPRRSAEQVQEPYEPAYVGQGQGAKEVPAPGAGHDWNKLEYTAPHVNGSGAQKIQNVTAYSGANYALDPIQQLQMQRMQQIQKLQLETRSFDDPSITFAGYGMSQSQAVPVAALPVAQPAIPEFNLGKGNLTDPSPDVMHSSKKKKDNKRKKKKRRKSSSSSSSSSDESSESRRRRKSKRGRDSDDSSDSSSDTDVNKQAAKEKQVSSGLTDMQKKALLAQKDGYQKKLEILEREILKLQTKEDELKRSRADLRLVDENLTLQAELKGRCKAVNIVLEKINDVLQVDKSALEKSRLLHPAPVPPPPPKISHPLTSQLEEKPVKKEISSPFDYVDDGLHWCRLCNVFPETVEKMLEHIHSQAHLDQVEQLGIDDKPWRKRNSLQNKIPIPGAQKVPYRGMQFFSPVEGWYCRLCNFWMGDHLCATDHLKSDEHNINYMNFLEEHPGWDSKWANDREKALGRVGSAEVKPKTEPRKSRFQDLPPPDLHVEDVGDENGKSIRVHMRNTIKVDENRSDFISKSETGMKDAGLDEWMGKPQKVALDILDTQKFAEIVRQKHGGNKPIDGRPVDENLNDPIRSSPQSSQGLAKNRDRDIRREEPTSYRDKRKYDRVELQLSSRDNRERDRYRDNRDRNRRPSRSRSRSRDRGYHGRRRSKSRSRDRDRDRRDRDSGGNARDRVEAVKKLPMIGKMPLYKRPLTFGKDKDKSANEGEHQAESEESSKMSKGFGYNEESNTSIPSDSGGFTSGRGSGKSTLIDFDGYMNEMKNLDEKTVKAAGETNVFIPVESRTTVTTTSTPVTVESDLKPPGEKEAPGGTNLPDDLQQALDIIYKGGGKPITIPPPSLPPPVISIPPPVIPTGVPPPPTYDYSAMQSGSNYQSYMGYEPYQMSFDGYAPASGFDDMEVNTNTMVESKVSGEVAVESSKAEDLSNPEDDMDDLRMLGIDLDDVAVVRR